MCKSLRMSKVARIIAIFGGLSGTARALDLSYPSVVQGWREREFIPPRYWPAIIKAASERGTTLTLEDFFDTPADAAE